MLIELDAAFKLFDSENTGKIMLRELHACIQAFGINMKKSVLKTLVNKLGIKN